MQTPGLLLVAGLALVLLATLAGLYIQQYQAAAATPKLGVSIAELRVIRDAVGVSVEVYIQNTGNSRVCIPYIRVDDIDAGTFIVLGDNGTYDGGLGEATGLPVCLEPGEALKLGGYHEAREGFNDGDRLMVRIYYWLQGEDPPEPVDGEPRFLQAYTRTLQSTS